MSVEASIYIFLIKDPISSVREPMARESILSAIRSLAAVFYKTKCNHPSVLEINCLFFFKIRGD